MQIDRRKFFKSVGGATAVALMTSEQKADALEEFMEEELELATLEQGRQTGQYPTVAELAEQNKDLTRSRRRGGGRLFSPGRDGKLQALLPMPEKPTLLDFFKYRFGTGGHVMQSAGRAMKTGMDEKVVLACLLHDVVNTLMSANHGWWGGQLIEPYVPEETAFAVRYHSALRFFPDSDYGYEYPESYMRTFGEDYVPEPYLQRTYEKVRQPQVVRVFAARNGERPLRVRPEQDGVDRAVHRHHRSPLQAAQGRPGATTTRRRRTCGGRSSIRIVACSTNVRKRRRGRNVRAPPFFLAPSLDRSPGRIHVKKTVARLVVTVGSLGLAGLLSVAPAAGQDGPLTLNGLGNLGQPPRTERHRPTR